PRPGGGEHPAPRGGPADTAATGWIEKRANDLLKDAQRPRRVDAELKQYDFIAPYVRDLKNVVDLSGARGLRLGVDPLGGSNLDYWDPIAAEFGLNLTVVNRKVDPTFGFLTLAYDGKIRMELSSP